MTNLHKVAPNTPNTMGGTWLIKWLNDQFPSLVAIIYIQWIGAIMLHIVALRLQRSSVVWRIWGVGGVVSLLWFRRSSSQSGTIPQQPSTHQLVSPGNCHLLAASSWNFVCSEQFLLNFINLHYYCCIVYYFINCIKQSIWIYMYIYIIYNI